MWRALAFLALLAIAAFGATWIADRPGTVTIVWNGYEVATSLAIALIGVLIAAIVIGFIWAVVRGIITLPEALVRGSKERRRAKGFSALSRGMVAVGSGDPLAARRHASDAERLLGAEPLALLLKAQAAQISGDREATEHAFQRMVNDPETRVLGLRGLFVEARRREDDVAARAYASEAARLAPSVTWANEAVLEAQCADGDWSGAVETVERRASLGLIEKGLARRQRAVLLTAAAQTREAGEPEAATQRALDAVKLAPDLVPAACIAGRLLARRGDLRKAAKIVEAAWRANPHPDLAKVYLGLRVGDSVRDRLARAETLAKISTWHPEARLAMAQAALEAQEFGKAREALAPLLAERPDRPHLPRHGEDRRGRARCGNRPGTRMAGQGRPRPARPDVDRGRNRLGALGAGLTGHRPSRRLRLEGADRVARRAVERRCHRRPRRQGRSQPTGPRACPAGQRDAGTGACARRGTRETRRTPAGERRRDGVETLRAGHGSDGTRCRDTGGVPPAEGFRFHV